MCVQPVVDDRGDERPLARHPRLALDHGGDREHVVRREVLAPRVREVRACATSRRTPRAASARAGRTSTCGRSRMCPGRGSPRAAASWRRSPGPCAASRSRRRTRPRSFTLRCDSCSAIFATACTRAAICARVNPSGKTTRNCRSWRTWWSAAPRRCVPPQPATSRRDQRGADGYERAAHHSSQPERRCAAASASSGAAPAVCCARSVVKRSSYSSTGTSRTPRSASTKRSVSAPALRV